MNSLYVEKGWITFGIIYADGVGKALFLHCLIIMNDWSGLEECFVRYTSFFIYWAQIIRNEENNLFFVSRFSYVFYSC